LDKGERLGWQIHLHLIAAISWIGGSVFMFVLGVSLRDKKDQQAVYPIIGPIFGYFEMVSLVLLLTTGMLMISSNGLMEILFLDIHNQVIDSLRYKLIAVVFLVVMTVVHFIVAMKTNGKERTTLQQFISRGSSMAIFMVNLLVLHYAIVIRNII